MNRPARNHSSRRHFLARGALAGLLALGRPNSLWGESRWPDERTAGPFHFHADYSLDDPSLSVGELAPFSAVLFDPPRAGAEAQAAMLAKSTVGVVMAVSCNPATFARDARILVDGGYAIERITPVDQFLFTPHVELVAVFRKGKQR